MCLSAAEPLIRPALAYSKPFGGSSSDYGAAIATDSAGNVYVAGNTTSADFPVKNALQPRLGGVPLRATTDGGNTWQSMGLPNGAYAVAGSAKAPGILYAGTASAIYKSADSGKTWTPLATAPQAQVNALLADPANPAVVYAGTSSGIFKSQDSGATWLAVNQQQWNILDLVANPARPTTLFAGISVFPTLSPSGGVTPAGPSLYRSTDAGVTWTALTGLPDPVIALVCDPANADALYASANPNGFGPFTDPSLTSIYKTADGGNTWKKLIDSPVETSTVALAAYATSVYAATTAGLIRSRDGGATWAPTAVTTAADNVAIDPNNSQSVYVSAGGILVSADGGSTWKTSLPIRQNVQTISTVPGSPTSVFVGATPGQNIFVSKWSGDGKQMIYSTYLGGSYYDNATGIAVDAQGNAYVSGYTYATDFPVTRGALQSKTTAPYSGFAAKISPDGSTLLYATYLSGSSGDAAFAIAVDGSGNAYLTGYAGSADFPVTSAALQHAIKVNCAAQTTLPPGDAFVTKISTDGSALLYSTFLGGSCADEGTAITVDGAGRAYIAGLTQSNDFPATKGAFQEKLPGLLSGFVAALAPQGNALMQASYIGGPADITTTGGVAVDAKGAVYTTGCTNGFDDEFFGAGIEIISFRSAALPPAGFSGFCTGAAYVLKLDPSVSSKVFLNYLGSAMGAASNVAVDPAGRVWVAGSETPADPFGASFPMVHPFQTRTGQGFVSQWSADGGTLLFSSRMDSANAMAMDGYGNVFLTGFTNPAEKNFAPSAFIARIDATVLSLVTVEDPQRITPGPALAGQNQGVAPGEILILPGGGMGPTPQAGPVVTFGGVPAPILSAQSDQIVCIVPFEVANTADGTTTMQVHCSNGSSNSIRMPVAATAVEAYAIANADGTPNTPDHPAAPGSIVTVYAAGYGDTNPPSVDGAINSTAGRPLKAGPVGVGIYAGSADGSVVPAGILFAGPAPGQVAGIVQINFRVPQLDPGQYPVIVGLSPALDNGDYDVINLNVGK